MRRQSNERRLQRHVDEEQPDELNDHHAQAALQSAFLLRARVLQSLAGAHIQGVAGAHIQSLAGVQIQGIAGAHIQGIDLTLNVGWSEAWRRN